QKMEAIATLAGGIAHDFNNILAPIMGYAEILLMRAGSDEELKSGLKKIFDSAMRAKEIVAQILTFSRSREGEARPVSVTSIVKEVIKLLSSSIPKTISIETDIREDIPPVVADPVHIHQILMNLCTNAFHAMEDQGGTLFIGLDVVEKKGVKYVKLTVSDTGQGIPSEHLHRIFEPYFTTKKLGKGTGLGLAIVHGIVEVYNGHLRVDSKVGQGTTFEVLLPARDGLGQPEGLEHDHPSSESITRFSGSILVVDDEDAVRRVLKGLVQELGLDVETASNAKEALQLLVEQKKTYDLIITDQTMPGMTGIELVKSLRQSGIETPVIICTGYNSKMDKRMGRELRIVDFLLKPVDVATLHRTLKKVFKR
ncbi:MAG TPA: response regulator, partial [Dissulfuribacter thermophilus]|nr:response regulator [Dissulfuribacter thermophilus]